MHATHDRHNFKVGQMKQPLAMRKIKLDYNALEQYRNIPTYSRLPLWLELQNFSVMLFLRIFFVVILLVMLVLMLVYPFTDAEVQNHITTFIGMCIVFVPTIYGAIGCIQLAHKSDSVSEQRSQALRAKHFIQDNDIGFVTDYPQSGHVGVIFNKKANSPTNPEEEHLFHPKNVLFIEKDGVRVEIGTVLTVFRSRWFRQRQAYGYMSLELSRPCPHIVVNAKANNNFWIDNLPVRFEAYERLSLEGNFDEYFTSWARDSSKSEALYILTPDLMALLIDNSSHFDLEIIDKNLYIYSNGGFDISDASLLERLIGIANSVGKKALLRTDNYRLPHDAHLLSPNKRIHRQNLMWLFETFGYALVILMVGVLAYSLWATEI